MRTGIKDYPSRRKHRWLWTILPPLMILGMLLFAGVIWNVFQIVRDNLPPSRGQECGTLHKMWNSPTFSTVENGPIFCFWNAYATCQPATVEQETGDEDSEHTLILTLKRQEADCQIYAQLRTTGADHFFSEETVSSLCHSLSKSSDVELILHQCDGPICEYRYNTSYDSYPQGIYRQLLIELCPTSGKKSNSQRSSDSWHQRMY